MCVKVACFILLAVVSVSEGSLLSALQAAHANPAFNNLDPADQLLIIELIAEVEAGELKAYVDHIGFHHVIAVIDKLPDAEAHILSNYLVQELQKEESMNNTMPAVGKRDLTSLLKSFKNDPHFNNLSQADKDLVVNMVTAAESRHLLDFVNKVGYSKILNLLQNLTTTDSHNLSQYLLQTRILSVRYP